MKFTNNIKLWMLIMLFAVQMSCTSSKPEEKGVVKADAGKITTVEVVKPRKTSFTGEIHITGTAKPNQVVKVHAMESGYVHYIRKDIGDAVRAGEVIAELRNPELVRQSQKLQAQVKAKQAIYERLKSTREKTPAITTIQLVEDAEADYLSVKAELDAVNDRISFLKVKAPFSGVITQRFVDKGALVQSGIANSGAAAIVEVQEINPVRVTIPLPETDVAAVREDMEVNVQFPELAGEAFTAKVSRTSKALDPASKTMQVEIDVQNPDGKIRPGMYAKARMQVSSRENILSLPVSAQTIYQNQPFLLVVRDNKVERVSLRKGLSNKDFFEVLNSEVGEEDMVIIQGKSLVKPGQIVEPVIKAEK
ncbi:efflux RND transporter periplasmic adaptor subunit [Cytophagaceae bacterium ABcell3]|nr:efflux RND transporter periplasmic adaptor subunit [Cytophagaceae bacterium ABcell3]